MSYCDFIAGWAGGVLGLVTGHPFDTVKVNQQTRGIGLVECMQHIHKTHGTKGFFRGLGFPLIANGTLNSLFFGVYGHTVEALVKFQHANYSYTKHRSASSLPRTSAPVAMKKTKVENAQATYLHCLVGGLVGGMVQLAVACPVEVVKIKLQTTKREHRARGPLTILQNIWHTQGPRGLYQGLGIMTFRDITAGAFHCLIYKTLLDKRRANYQKPYPWYTIFTAAGFAGTVSWWTIIPLDVIKSRMQADDPMAPRYKNVKDCALQIFRSQGYRGFFKGFWPMSLRAFPVNGATFLAYEWINWTCLSVIGSGSK